MTPPLILTDRLTLRPISLKEGDRVVEILSDFRVSKWLSRVPHPFTHDDLRLTTSDGMPRWPEICGLDFQGQLIGAVGAGEAFGYYIAPEYWGRGFASEAARAVLGLCFDNLGFEKLEAGHFIGNDASARILEKLGFQELEQGAAYCAARDCKLPHVSWRLDRDDWQASR